MANLDEEARMTIKTLARKGVSNRESARLLGVSEGTVRYQLKKMESQAVDGRSLQEPLAAGYEEAIEYWRTSLPDKDAVNLAMLHAWLVAEHDYSGSLRSVQRYWSKTYPAPKIRARRRIA